MQDKKIKWKITNHYHVSGEKLKFEARSMIIVALFWEIVHSE